MNMNIYTDFGCFKTAPTYFCKGLYLRKGFFWIQCIAKVLDIYKTTKKRIKQKNVKEL